MQIKTQWNNKVKVGKSNISKWGILAISFLLINSCKVSDTGKFSGEVLEDQPLVTLGKDTIPAGDFMYAFRKNNIQTPDTSITNSGAGLRDSINQYLDLYVNFRLKLKAAMDSGYHESEDFREELEGYRDQLAQPYLTSTSIRNQVIKTSYEHLKSEVNASHILIRLDEDASPSDTLGAYNLLDSIRREIQQGAGFKAMANKYSEDPSASDNGGNLGYFTAFQMVYPFEKVVYNLDIGDISQPFRTRFGYHIVKLNDKRPARDRLKVAHIMIRSRSDSAENKASPEERIREVYQKLQQGGDWNKLCRQYSEDPSTRAKGGTLPYISTGMMMDNFEETAYNLDQIGDISEPIQTPYGWHILKLEDRKPLPSFEEMKPKIERQISESSRSEIVDQKVINALKNKFAFQEYEDSVSMVFNSIKIDNDRDSLILGKTESETTLFAIDGLEYRGKDFLKFFQKEFDVANASEEKLSQELIASYYDDYVSGRLEAYERENLQQINEEYKRLLEEYRNGILLFNIMEDRVWSKANEDSTGLYNYFKRNYQDYNTNRRIVVTIFSGGNQQIINAANREIGNFNEILPSPVANSLEAKINNDGDRDFSIIQGNYSMDSINHYEITDILKTINWEKGQYMIEKGNRKYQVHVHRMIPSGVRNFENVKGLVMADYQEYIEEKWVRELREKNPVKVNTSVLEKVVKNLEQNYE